eukprot:601489-Hanusia_phi.AAC.3
MPTSLADADEEEACQSVWRGRSFQVKNIYVCCIGCIDRVWWGGRGGREGAENKEQAGEKFALVPLTCGQQFRAAAGDEWGE